MHLPCQSYRNGKYQLPPFGRMMEYIVDSERNKFEALNTIKSYMGTKTAIYYAFFEVGKSLDNSL